MSTHIRAFDIRSHGVAIYAAVCVAWCVFVTLLVLRQGYPEAAYTLAVPAGEHPFGDMRIAADGIEAAGRGQDVIDLDYLPRDYFPIRFPYHRSWLAFRHLDVSGSRTEILAIVLGLAMVVHFGVLIASTGNCALTGLVLAAFACSPPAMLALERGNPDLFLYLLLAGACQLLARRSFPAQAVGFALIFAAGALKFFPFAGALGMIPGDRSRQRGRMLLAFIAAALLFLVIERSEVMRIATSPLAANDWASFGSAVSANTLSRVFTRVTGIDVPAVAPGVLRWCGVVALSLVVWTQSAALAPHAVSLDRPRGVSASGFAAAGGIFTASFVLMRSYNYKFIFLALAIPALCEWSRRGDPPGRTARWALAALLLWMWSGLNGYVYLGMNIFGSWVCVGCVATLLVASLRRHAGIQAWTGGAGAGGPA